MMTETKREPQVGTKEGFELALTELYVYYSRNRSEERADKLLDAIRAYVDGNVTPHEAHGS